MFVVKYLFKTKRFFKDCIHLATKQIFTTLCLNTSLRQFPHELEEYFYAKIHNLTTGRKEIQKNVCQFSIFFFKVVTTLQRTKVTVFVVKYLFETKRFFKDCPGRRSSRCKVIKIIFVMKLFND